MIRPFMLVEISEYLRGNIICNSDINAGCKTISGISIDSRSIIKGELFVAIKGPNFDGHECLKLAQNAGAIAVVVEQVSEYIVVPQIQVADTFKALGLLGLHNRSEFHGKVLAVTGSCGKTSVKEMLSAILAEKSNVLSTSGNMNNGYGVPLTLFKLQSMHDNAVIELGTSSPGEIKYIAGLAKPDIALITNAAEAHLADLLSIQGVAWEKGFILDALCEGGVAVLNYDDVFYSEWRQRVKAVVGRKIVTFSLNNTRADCFASDIQIADNGITFIISLLGARKYVNLSFWGRHQVANACCAATACMAAGLSLDTIVSGLENARPYQRRGLRYVLPASNGKTNVIVFDETYNANPKATLVAIDQLSECYGKSIMVFGDMLELGSISQERHEDIGFYAKQKGIDYFLGFGSLAKNSCNAFGKEGKHFDNKDALIAYINFVIARESDHTVSVLVKGSKCMKMLDVVRSLVGPEYEGGL